MYKSFFIFLFSYFIFLLSVLEAMEILLGHHHRVFFRLANTEDMFELFFWRVEMGSTLFEGFIRLLIVPTIIK